MMYKLKLFKIQDLINIDNILLNRIHLQLILPHKHIPIQIIDKRTWNDFLDDINIGFYPYLILIMTSNISNEDIGKKYDISYLRENRIHLSYKLMKNSST